jgi:membrane-associated phospholipid phosphatase
VPVPAPSARSELAFIVALVAFVAFVYLGVTVSLGVPGGIDTDFRESLIAAFHGDPWPSATTALNLIGSLETQIVVSIGLVALFLGQRRLGPAIAIAATWLVAAFTGVLEGLLMRPAPPDAILDTAVGEAWSFPSGHVVRTVAFVAILAWIAASRSSWNRRTALALASGLIAGLVIGIARIATGSSWPTDVLGGLLLGSVAVLVFALAAEVAVSRRSPAGERPPPPSPLPDSA